MFNSGIKRCVFRGYDWRWLVVTVVFRCNGEKMTRQKRPGGCQRKEDSGSGIYSIIGGCCARGQGLFLNVGV